MTRWQWTTPAFSPHARGRKAYNLSADALERLAVELPGSARRVATRELHTTMNQAH